MEAVEARLNSLETKVDKIIEGLEAIALNLSHASSKIDNLKGNSEATMETVEVRLETIINELHKINRATGYDGMSANEIGLPQA